MRGTEGGAKILPAVRPGTQSVVNVKGGKTETERFPQGKEKMEQNDRIEPTAQSQRHPPVRMALEDGGYMSGEVIRPQPL